MSNIKKSPYGPIKFTTIEEYHACFPPNIQIKLDQIRKAIKQIAPDAKEIISYNIPTFKMNKNLVHYAAYKDHIGFYPTSSLIEYFKEELTQYKTSKGAIQFPINEKLPVSLIKKIVKLRVLQDTKITLGKKTLRTCKNGHQYLKTSSCPTCPECEAGNRPQTGFLSLISAPARRALQNENINTLKQLSNFTEGQILKLHGVGKTTIPILKGELKKKNLEFKKHI